MKIKDLFLSAIAFSLFTATNDLFSQTWTPTTAPSNAWNSIACSADGRKVVASAFGSLYTSTNSGTTWVSNNVPQRNWFSVASSADGTKLLAGTDEPTDNALVLSSTNSGQTWTMVTNLPLGAVLYYNVACSADGSLLAAAAYYSNDRSAYLTSRDGGLTWTSNNLPSGCGWWSIACSADGSRQVVAGRIIGRLELPGVICISTNSGSSWFEATNAPRLGWVSIACSADANKIIAGGGPFPGGLSTSQDLGSTWTTRWDFLNVDSVASSADGSRLMTGWTNVYTSNDSGTTWTASNLPFVPMAWSTYSVACSADGCRLWAASYFAHQIYTSESVPSPVLELAPSRTNLVVSWIVPSTNFVLQQNAALNSTNWTDVAPAPIFNASTLHYQMTFTPANNRTFWRLNGR